MKHLKTVFAQVKDVRKQRRQKPDKANQKALKVRLLLENLQNVVLEQLVSIGNVRLQRLAVQKLMRIVPRKQIAVQDIVRGQRYPEGQENVETRIVRKQGHVRRKRNAVRMFAMPASVEKKMMLVFRKEKQDAEKVKQNVVQI